MRNLNTKKVSVRDKLKEKLKHDLSEAMNVGDREKRQVHVASVINANLEQDSKLIEISLDKLKPYDKNPRLTANPMFDSIKESIRKRGLDFAPNVTKRPGEDYYIIADGGNTRLKALHELFTETQDPKFWVIKCLYKPWEKYYQTENNDEYKLLIAHLIENDTRADLSFIEKALGILDAKKYYEKNENKNFSARELALRLAEDGYIIHYTALAKMLKAIELLYPAIPNLLLDRLSRNIVEKILTIYSRLDKYWQEKSFDLENKIEFKSLWLEAIKFFDSEKVVCFKLADFKSVIIDKIIEELGVEAHYDEILNAIENKNKEIEADEVEQDEIATSASNYPDYSLVTTDNAINSLVAKTINYPENNENTVAPVTDEATPEHVESANPVIANPGDKLASEVAAQNTQTSTSDAEVSVATAENEVLSAEQQNIMQQLSGGVSKSANPLDIRFDVRGALTGYSMSESKALMAKFNQLEFANTGNWPVWDVWRIPNFLNTPHHLTTEIYFLLIDLGNEVGLDIKACLETLGLQTVPMAFKFNDSLQIDKAKEPAKYLVYNLAKMVADGKNEAISLELAESLLLGTNIKDINNTISDVIFVKFLRVLILTRQYRRDILTAPA